MSWKLRGQVPGQEFLDTVDRVIGDALQDMAKIEFGVEIVELSRAEQAVNGRRAFAAGIGSGKEIILASQSDHTQCPFGCRVVYFDCAIVEVTAKRTPPRERVADGRRSVGFARESRERLMKPVMQVIHQGPRSCLAD